MARELSLTNFVLLACQFEIVGEAADRVAETAIEQPIDSPGIEETTGEEPTPEPADAGVAEAPSDEPGTSAGRRIEVAGARIDCTATQDDDEFVLVMHAELTDETAPYQLQVITGSRFTVPDEPPSLDAVIATLVFISYPYLRETVFAITGRSPYQAFTLPPLTRLPHPRVTGDQPQSTVE